LHINVTKFQPLNTFDLQGPIRELLCESFRLGFFSHL